jgi:serine/threonine protein kinase
VANGTPSIQGFSDLRLLGRGGFSVVYEATQSNLGRRVAIKVLSLDLSDPAAQLRFDRECRAVGVLSGISGIVGVHQSAFADDGRPCIVMELMERGSLEKSIAESGPLSPEDGQKLGLVLGGALAAVDERGVVHRDIKPGNILISSDGGMALADFGISIVADLENSSQTAASLSPPYAPPERFMGGRVDERLADIYSLGSSMYFAMTGAEPFGTSADGGISGLMKRVMDDPVPPIGRPEVPDGFSSIIEQMMAKRPGDRFASASAVHAAFVQLDMAASATITRRTVDVSRTAPVREVLIPPQPLPDVTGSFAGSTQWDLARPSTKGPRDRSGRPWPTPTDYVGAVQDSAALLDADLRSATLRRDSMGMPVSAVGQSAIVFQMDSPDGPIALRCYTRQPDQGAERYEALGRHLLRNPCHDLVAAHWVESALRVGEEARPAVTMPWVPGRPVNLVLEDNLDRPEELRRFADGWLQMLERLRRANLAHGDLQNGNVLVDGDMTIRLVDLDGVWVPELDGQDPAEIGHPHFQHPGRTSADWGRDVDAFAGLVVYLSTIGLASDQDLWDYHNGENLIFTAADFGAPGDSSVWTALTHSENPEVRALTNTLADICRSTRPPRASVAELLDSDIHDAEKTVHRPTRAASASFVSPGQFTRLSSEKTNDQWWSDEDDDPVVDPIAGPSSDTLDRPIKVAVAAGAPWLCCTAGVRVVSGRCSPRSVCRSSYRSWNLVCRVAHTHSWVAISAAWDSKLRHRLASPTVVFNEWLADSTSDRW